MPHQIMPCNTGLDYSVIATVVSSISALLSLVFAIYIAFYGHKLEEKRRFSANVARLLELTLEYPEFDMESICSEYPNITPQEKKKQYENYCCFVFNIMSQGFRLHKKRIRNYLYVDELITRHVEWWYKDTENSGYGKEFKKFIDKSIADLIDKGMIKHESKTNN